MPQISLYVDQKTLDLIEKAATSEHLSISKWVRQKLKKSLAKSWPHGYFELCGSIADPSFKRQEQPGFGVDSKRESF